MTLTAIILLILLGLILVLLEILVVPGLVVGIIGGALMVGGVVSAWYVHGATTGAIVLGGTVAITIISILLAFRSKTWNKAALHSEIDSRVNILNENSINVGDRGIAISRLAPMGKALINDQQVEVQSIEGYVNENSRIVVVKVAGNKVLVRTEQ